MTEEFDPYLELLGIEPEERPPSHYVLLDVEDFESDPSEIEKGAGRRMAALQEMANSDYLDASQKLLNEVSAARRCLLDVTEKIAYDERLRAKRKRSTASQKTNPWIRIVPVAVVVVVLLIVLIMKQGATPEPKGNLIIQWPTTERDGAAVYIDGEKAELSDSEMVAFEIPNGRHRVTFKRAGYRDNTIKRIFDGRQIKAKLRWTPDSGE